jgi:hypothetical protein
MPLLFLLFKLGFSQKLYTDPAAVSILLDSEHFKWQQQWWSVFSCISSFGVPSMYIMADVMCRAAPVLSRWTGSCFAREYVAGLDADGPALFCVL